MNIHSFIYLLCKYRTMSKRCDLSKIEKIRDAAVEVISENGILNSSVASIARVAQVSVGYLYRHYPSKEDLINELLNEAINVITDRIDELMNTRHEVKDVIEGVVSFIIENADKNPSKYKFLIMLLNDFSIRINPQIKERINLIGTKLIALGNKTKELKKEITVSDLYTSLIGIPMQHLSSVYRFNFNNDNTNNIEQLEKIKAISLQIVMQ